MFSLDTNILGTKCLWHLFVLFIQMYIYCTFLKQVNGKQIDTRYCTNIPSDWLEKIQERGFLLYRFFELCLDLEAKTTLSFAILFMIRCKRYHRQRLL